MGELSNEERAEQALKACEGREFRRQVEVIANLYAEAEERGREEGRAAYEGVVSDLHALNPCEWADLSHLSGEALRERLKARVKNWQWASIVLTGTYNPQVSADVRILIDLIRSKAESVSAEVERLANAEAEGSGK